MNIRYVIFSMVTVIVVFSSTERVLAEPVIAWVPVDASVPHTINGNEIIVEETGGTVTLEIHISGWGDAPGAPMLGAYQTVVRPASFASGDGEALTILGAPDDPPSGAFIDIDHPEFVFQPCCVNTIVTGFPGTEWSGVTTDAAVEDVGQTGYGGTLILEVPTAALGRYTVKSNEATTKTFLNSELGFPIQGTLLIPATITVKNDIPTASVWGMINMGILILACASVLVRRRGAC